jgi:agmatine deiminase
MICSLPNSRSIFISLVIVLSSCQEPKDDFYMPAEWEPQKAVWMAMFGNPRTDQVTARIISALHKNVEVKILYTDEELIKKQKYFLSTFNIDTTVLEFVKDSMQYLHFMRDPGPIFLINDRGQKKIADFNWNRLGNIYFENSEPLGELDFIVDRVDQRIAKKLNIETIRSELVFEGGSIEVNGKGLLMAIEETALQRNPGKSLREIQEGYLSMLGCRKIIWLKRSVLHDLNTLEPVAGNFITSGGNGHIDEMARFVGTNTVLLAEISEDEKNNNLLNQLDYEILEENYQILLNSKDQDGNPLKVIRMPYPDVKLYSLKVVLDDHLRGKSFYDYSKFHNGDTIFFTRATSYMNFFISNKVVLMPEYWAEGLPVKEKWKDQRARDLMDSIFKEREIIQINPFQINRAGGGIHCATQPEPI